MYSHPEPLRANDVVGIFLPSSPAREPFRNLGLRALQDIGLTPREVHDPLSRNDFLSRSPAETIRDMQMFFSAGEVKALWAGRGGYGSNYLLPLLDTLDIATPKIVVASSDVSYLLWYLLERRRMIVFYGPMVYGALAASACEREQAMSVLCGGKKSLRYQGRVLCSGRARGMLSGGCLSNFVSLLGTPHLPELKDRILLLEDVNERPFRLDRMLWQCEQAGVFGRIQALLLGEFPCCFKDDGEKESFYWRWREKWIGLGIPVLYNMPFGHARSAQILPLGVEAGIDTEAEGGTLRCENGVKQ